MQVLPRFTALLAEWQPLEEPGRGLQELSSWRPLLESDAQRDGIFQVPYISQIILCQLHHNRHILQGEIKRMFFFHPHEHMSPLHRICMGN